MPGGSRLLFDHVTLPVRDIARSRAFYERALQPFGVRVVQSSQGPGFAIDEAVEHLGERLMLPPEHESNREALERALPPLDLREVSARH